MWLKTSLYSLVDAALSLAGRKKGFLQSNCNVKIDGALFLLGKKSLFSFYLSSF